MQGDAVHVECKGAAVHRGLLHIQVAEGLQCVQSARGAAGHAEFRKLHGVYRACRVQGELQSMPGARGCSVFRVPAASGNEGCSRGGLSAAG